MTISNLVAVQGEGDPLGYTYGEPELLDFNDNGYVLFRTDRGGAPPVTLWLWDGVSVSNVVTEGDALGGGIYVNTLGGGGGGGGAATTATT